MRLIFNKSKNRASTVEGLLQNYELIDEVIAAAENADGSALKENEKYMQGLTAKTQLFQTALEELVTTLLNSDLVGWFVDFGTTGINAIQGLATVLKTLGSAFGLLDSDIGGMIGAISGLIMNLKGAGKINSYCKVPTL